MKEKLWDIYKRYKKIIRYLIVGGLTTVVSLATYYLCVLTVLDPQNPWQLQAANVISWVAAVAFAYVTNRIYVFESQNSNKLRELVSFVEARLLTLFMDMAVMFLLVTVAGCSDKVAKLVVQVLVTVANYLLSQWMVFKDRRR